MLGRLFFELSSQPGDVTLTLFVKLDLQQETKRYNLVKTFPSKSSHVQNGKIKIQNFILQNDEKQTASRQSTAR